MSAFLYGGFAGNKTTNKATNCQNVRLLFPVANHIHKGISSAALLIWAGIANRYGLDGPASNPGGGEIFRTRLYRTWGPTCLP
jgi:hypothetical protein